MLDDSWEKSLCGEDHNYCTGFLRGEAVLARLEWWSLCHRLLNRLIWPFFFFFSCLPSSRASHQGVWPSQATVKKWVHLNSLPKYLKCPYSKGFSCARGFSLWSLTLHWQACNSKMYSFYYTNLSLQILIFLRGLPSCLWHMQMYWHVAYSLELVWLCPHLARKGGGICCWLPFEMLSCWRSCFSATRQVICHPAFPFQAPNAVLLL